MGSAGTSSNCSTLLWDHTCAIELLNDSSLDGGHIVKIASIDNHLYLLSDRHHLYHGTVILREHDGLRELSVLPHPELRLRDVACAENVLYVVHLDGRLHALTESFELIADLSPVEPARLCPRGHTVSNHRLTVDRVYVGRYGLLLITDNGQLWARGDMHEIGINAKARPERVGFFEDRCAYSAGVGDDFAVAIVSKQSAECDDDGGSGADGDEAVTGNLDEDDLMASCATCQAKSNLLSNTRTGSLNSLLSDKVTAAAAPASYDIETTSTSSKSDCSSRISADGADHNRSDRNIIFRNTEAAKDFLSRQFNRMSSAGEEYLIECTEKPTRIIKENVTHVASFVYDKVATLSRHVSGSSETNDEATVQPDVEQFDNTDLMLHTSSLRRLPRVTSKDELSWSTLSQTTSAGGCEGVGGNSSGGIADVLGQSMLTTGAALLNLEVWSWGNIVHGQLGIGDIMKRERPLSISRLSYIGAAQLLVQRCHAACVTLDGRTFLWGRNDSGQVTVESSDDQSSPRQLNPPAGSGTDRMLAVACGDRHSVALTTRHELLYLGKSDDQNNRKVEQLYIATTSPSVLRPSALLATERFTALSLAPRHDFIVRHLVQEQLFLESLLLVHTQLFKQLLKKTAFITEPQLFEQLCRHCTELMQFTAASVQSLSAFANKSLEVTDIVTIRCHDEHVNVYKHYLDDVFSVLSIGGAGAVGKLVDVPVALYKCLNGTTPVKRDRKTDEMVITKVLMEPYAHLTFYSAMFADISDEMCLKTDVISGWQAFCEEQATRRSEAETTRSFWVTASRVLDSYKLPQRRLIRDSRNYALSLTNASRFTTHYFLLFNDVFVHVAGSAVTSHHLGTVWVEPVPEANNGSSSTSSSSSSSTIFAISIRTPEETLELSASEAEQKMKWFHILQTSIKTALGKPHLAQPPVSRTTGYTFLKAGPLKDATYRGRWANGKLHGSGTLQWPDGRIYSGQFNNNDMHGFGKMNMPNVGVYEGQWKENQRNGFGILKYSNGDLYKGLFKDGMPHGHGSLKQGHFTASSASLYIGDWNMGNKSGYGILDDIVSGEKYLGNWLDNKKHGNGLVVTADGVYYEGEFNQDILTGHGLMILEDGTHYEGDFKGTGVLCGKGVLTLQSGHKIEGNLSGSYADGIKISSGTFSLAKEATDTPKAFGTFSAQVDHKWRSLFKHFYQILGVPCEINGNTKTVELQKIWQNVAVILNNSQNNSQNKKSLVHLENSINSMDTIPHFGKDSIDSDSYLELKKYLLKAFEYTHHPLGVLQHELTIAYNATYGGLRAHPLLLQHAVHELHYVIKKMYDFVKLLFPALPPYRGDITLELAENERTTINFRTILYPIVLPKVYLSLFTLYSLKNKHQDTQYCRRLREWNKQPDETLMVFLSVDKKFLNLESVDQNRHIPTYIESIETLQQLKTTFSPIEKLHVIRDTFKAMTSLVQRTSLGPNYRWNMDDLLPVFLYVVVRARIPELGSEIDFIEDFIAPNIESGELSVMFTTLQACYQQILQEKVSIN